MSLLLLLLLLLLLFFIQNEIITKDELNDILLLLALDKILKLNKMGEK